MLFKLVLENLSKEEAEEFGKITNKFFMHGMEFDVRPNFQIVLFMPASLTKVQKNN